MALRNRGRVPSRWLWLRIGEVSSEKMRCDEIEEDEFGLRYFDLFFPA